jgi:6-phosphogluconolactonase
MSEPPGPTHELIQFPDAPALAQAVAARWLAEMPISATPATPYSVALAGGRIARDFYRALVAQAAGRRTGLGHAHFFWGDERCVPPTDPENSYAVARDLLFNPLHTNDDQIHRIRGEDPEMEALAQAEAELCRVAALDDDGQPVLDLVLLGMGEDGHVASLFPAEPAGWVTDRRVYRAVTATKPPPRRITLGYRALAAARQVWVLASGAGKETALRNSLAGGGQTPLGRLMELRARTVIFSDIPPAKE